MAHNLARWTARIGLGEQIVTTKTLRRRFFALAGRITRSARRLTLHLPQRWPWETQFSRALARLRAIPLPALQLALSLLWSARPCGNLPGLHPEPDVRTRGGSLGQSLHSHFFAFRWRRRASDFPRLGIVASDMARNRIGGNWGVRRLRCLRCRPDELPGRDEVQN